MTLEDVTAVFKAEGEAEQARRARKLDAVHDGLIESGEVRHLACIPLGKHAFPAEEAFCGAEPSLTAPFVLRESHAFVIEYDDERGDVRLILFHPYDEERALKAPMMARFAESRVGRGLERVIGRDRVDLKSALRSAGFVPTDIDFVASPHLMRMDPRAILGSLNEPPLLPRAEMLVAHVEWARAADPHPAIARWYVPGCVDGIDEGRARFVDEPEMLGRGIALLPLGADGTLSLAVHTPRGVMVLSDRGVATECWTPAASEISGLAERAAALGFDAVPRRPVRGTLQDAVTAMVVEREIAGAAHERADHCNVVPVAGLVSSVFVPRLKPTFVHTFEENWRIGGD